MNGDIVRRLHGTKWEDFFKIYPIRKNLKKSRLFRIAIVICFIFSFFSFYSSNSLELLVKIIDLNLSIIPNVLGFALGGYAMLIGGFSDSVLNKLVKVKPEDYNTFQKTSATFGVALLVMCFSLILNYLIKWLIYTEITLHLKVAMVIASGVNIFAIFIVNVISIYSILLTINVVKNIFAFSQLISGLKTIEKLKNENNKDL